MSAMLHFVKEIIYRSIKELHKKKWEKEGIYNNISEDNILDEKWVGFLKGKVYLKIN